MIKKILSILVIVYVFMCFSCNTVSYTNLPHDTILDELYINSVDSLAELLENKINSSTLSDDGVARYGFWLTKVHYKQNRNLVNDTLIHLSIPYFRETKSLYLSDALRLAAKQVNWSQNNPKGENMLLKEALKEAELFRDTNRILKLYEDLSITYNDMNDHLKTIEILHKMNRMSSMKKGRLKPIRYNAYLSLGDIDSALYYAKRDMIYSQIHKYGGEYENTRVYAEILNLSNQSEKALTVLRNLDRKFPNREQDIILLNYISTWFNLEKPDSAKVYINKLDSLFRVTGKEEEIGALLFVTKAFQLLYDSEKQLPITFIDIGLHADNVMNRHRNVIRVDREQLFVRNKLIYDNLKLDIERNKLRQGILVLSIITLILVGIIVYFYQRKLLRKERYAQKSDKQLRLNLMRLKDNESVIRKNESIIKTLTTQLDKSDELKESIQKQLSEIDELNRDNEILRVEIDKSSQILQQKDQVLIFYEKIAEQNASLQDRERFLTSKLIDQIEILHQLRKTPRYIDETQWHEIIDEINLLYDNFVYRLHSDYPSLTEEDLRYCSLLKLQLPISVISTLTAVSPSSVTKRKQRIKDKMSRQKSGKNIKERPLEVYLWSY